ncbi:MAG: SipW-dependent-type signal peptide-containing protein [Christensenellales bacterium]
MKKKTFVLLLALVLIAGAAVGGTLAWLTDTTEAVQNTFTTSDIDITLVETTTAYKMIPGWTIDKDPKVTVDATSEDCYLFVKVEKSSNFDTYMEYAIDTDWTALTGVDGVYYIEIDTAAEKGVAFNILGAGTKAFDSITYTWADNQVLVKPTVTKANMEALDVEGAVKPTLTFTAYAVQLYKSNSAKFTPAEAWNLAKDLTTTP